MMEITIRTNGTSVDINILGTIKTIADGQEIKDAVRRAYEQDNGRTINVYVKDSFIITSSVIGFLIKSIKIDKMALFIYVTSSELYAMLEDMNLITSMNVRKA
jgi:hypothetical protein